MKRRWMGAAVLVAGLGGIPSGVAHAQVPRYRVVKVLDQWGEETYRVRGQALNDSGVAIGQVPSTDWQPDQYGLVYDGRGKTRLFGPNGVNGSSALDINNKGQIAGQSYVWVPQDGRSPPITPLVWENDVPRALPLPSGFTAGAATAINELGEVIGTIVPADGGNVRWAWWRGAEVTQLPADFTAMDLNGLGQIAGCRPAANVPQGLPGIYENGQFRALPLPSPTSIGCATKLNEKGVAVGTMSNRATLWQKDGSLLTLVPPGTTTFARALNDRGEVLGSVGTPSGYFGFFYRPTSGSAVWDLGTLIDLQPDQQWLDRGLHSLYAMNNKGEILAGMGKCCTDTGGTLEVLVVLAPQAPTGGDTQPPVVAITSPATGSYLTDLAVLQATASDDVGVAGVQFYVNGKPAGAEQTTPPYRYELDLVPYADGNTVTFWALARDAAGNKTTTNIKTLVAQKSCVTVQRGQWANNYIGSQQGTFTITWTAAPDRIPANAGFGVMSGRGIDYRAAAAAVAFAPDGQFQVRDGDHLNPTGVPYEFGNYRFRMVVDVATRHYSAWARLPNQAERALGSNLAMQLPATFPDFWVASTDPESPAGALTVCNVKAKTGP